MKHLVARLLRNARERALARWAEADADYRDAMRSSDIIDLLHCMVIVHERRSALRRADRWLDWAERTNLTARRLNR